MTSENTAATPPQTSKPKKTGTKKNSLRSGLTFALVIIVATPNNTIVSVTDELNGELLIPQYSAGKFYKGSKKSTPFAAKDVTTKAILHAKSLGIKTINVVVKGIGPGRDAALEAIKTLSMDGQIIPNKVQDATPYAHNGCRAPKKRRV